MSTLKELEYLDDYSANDYSDDDYQIKAEQVVYVDFDGGSTSYNGELLTIDHLMVEHSGLSAERIEYIVKTLNKLYGNENVSFTIETPASGEYSTVFVGRTDAFDFLGEIYGISETVDAGNQNTSDNAFVLLDATASNDLLVSVISHEVGHLLGESHGGEGIDAYLAESASTNLTTAADIVNPDDGVISFREAITVYYAAGVSDGLCTITFDSSLNGVPLEGSGGLFNQVYSNTLIQGNGAGQSIIGHTPVDDDDPYPNHVLIVGNNYTLTLRDVTYHNLRVVDDATLNVSSGGIAADLMTAGNVQINVHSSGVVTGGQLNSTAQMTVSFGGYAEKIIVDNNAAVFLKDGAVISDFQLYGVMEASSGSILSDTVIGRDGIMYVSSGALVNGGYYTDHGIQYYASGATITGWQNFNGNASQFVAAGASADISGVFGDNAVQFIGAGAFVKGATFEKNAVQYIESDAIASGVTFKGGAIQNVSSGASAVNTLLQEGGTQVVFSGGITSNSTVNNGGVMSLYEGAEAEGTTKVAGQMIVDGKVDTNGGSLYFVLDDNTPDDPVLVDGLDNLLNVSHYEVTVNPAMSSLGEYVLATGASNFKGTITLSDWGWPHGDLTVNGDAVISARTGIAYFLKLDDAGNLTLLVRVAETPSNHVTMFTDTVYAYDDTYSFREAMTTYANSSDETVNVTFSAAGTFILDSNLVITHSNIVLSGLGKEETILGGSGSEIIISGGGRVTFDSATVNGLSVQNGSAVIGSAAIANNFKAVAAAGESAVVDLYGYTSNGEVGLNGKVNVLDGGFLTDFYMAGGIIAVSSGGIISGGFVGGSDFNLQIYDGGLVNALNMNQGNASVFEGGLVQNGWFYTSTTLSVMAGGSSFSLTLGNEAVQTVAGTADNTVLRDSAGQTVLSGGLTKELFIYDNTSASIKAGGSATGVVWVGNYLELEDGAVTTGAIVTLDLTGRQASATYMINRIDLLANGINTITHYASLAQGIYKLAGNAANYTAAIASGESMEIGGQFHYTASTRYSGMANGSTRYALVLDADNTLTLVIHDRYELLDNANTEYIAEDVSYNDMRGGASAGIYAVLNRSYQAMIFGGGSQTAVSGQVTLDVLSGTTLATHLFGGGYGSDVGGSTEINLYAGATANGYVFGGSYNGSVTSNAVINADGGTANAIYGGGRADVSGASAHVETATINLESGFSALKSNSYVYGGGITAAAGVTATVTSVEITVNGARLSYLHGGGQASNGSASVDRVTVTVGEGSSFTGYLYGGGRASGSATSTAGEVILKIDGGSFTYVFGGGYSSAGGLSTVDTVKITVNSGTFSGSLYGGAHRSETGTGTASVGDINITLDLTAGVVDFASGMGVVMGGTTTSVVTGNTTLTLTGSGDKLKTAGGTFTGWLTAEPDYGIDHSKTHTLSFTNFVDSDFQARVRGFNHADFSGSTAVTVTSYFGWWMGTDFSFDLSGRSSMSGTAFMKQETGHLGITADSVFNIGLNSSDLSGTSGSFLLLDGMDGVKWEFGSDCVNLTFGNSSGTGTFNGSAIELDGYLFNLVYDQTGGAFLLTWSYGETGDSSRSLLQGILA